MRRRSMLWPAMKRNLVSRNGEKRMRGLLTPRRRRCQIECNLRRSSVVRRPSSVEQRSGVWGRLRRRRLGEKRGHGPPGCRTVTCPEELRKASVLAGGLRDGVFLRLALQDGRRGVVFARRHGDDDVLALLVAHFGDAEDEFVLADAKLGDFADRQKDGMLIVFWPDAEDDVIGLQDVLLAKELLGLLMLAVGAEYLSGDGFGAFLLGAARRRVHTNEHALLVVVFFGRADAGEKQANCNGAELHVDVSSCPKQRRIRW